MPTQSSPVQYAFALDENGILTHISKAQRIHSYTCPGCKNNLSPVLGEINAKHFRHSEECCSLETYLHKSAKEAFFRSYLKAINTATPIVLALERTVFCNGPRLRLMRDAASQCSKSVPARYDLTKFFDQVDLEKRDATTGLQPDVMLSDSSGTRRCYIEICVTHASTKEKIDTGIPILEFRIQSMDDIAMLLSGNYSCEDERLNIFNWSPPPRIDEICTGNCTIAMNEMSVWQLSDSGRLKETITLLSEVDLITNSEINTWPRTLGTVELEKSLRNFLLHVDPQVMFANCIMCSQSSSWESGFLNCHSKNKIVPYTEALQCSAYKART
ncbi:hypothetical protein [Vibrio splendidus]|uniref:hypothetical protein n=1 Tax=Vibrio splendidus TaxID=29497 RepID=UPI000D3A0956|nr:hypothetical protein [Vibrio splendidus]PTP55205.1 hypothetical protein CWO05_06755 [Vibrio splendidus]